MSNDEFTKLSKQMQEGFTQVGKHFKRVDKKLTDHDTSFEKIDIKLTNHDKSFVHFFNYVQKEFAYVRSELTDVRSEITDVKGAVSDLAGQIKDYHQELLMLGRKVDRMERAIMHIAQETGVKLKFDF